MKKQLKAKLEERSEQFVQKRKIDDEKIIKKQKSLRKRKAEIVKVMATGRIISREQMDDQDLIYYNVHLKYFIHQGGHFYLEEEVEMRKASYFKGAIFEDVEVPVIYPEATEDRIIKKEHSKDHRASFYYDRLNAVRYAERWWNSYNPAYKKFDVDCTNYISQCLHAGGAPMRGYPNRSKGWWHQNRNWSYSWAVANSLKSHLQTSTAGLKAREVKDPMQLKLGDVICYDFQGDGRFDHNTIVTGKDAAGMPLVNAHTYNSRMRYWAYEDSSAYTPNIKYKMFTIIDDA
ncbi:amidase domain-containing protein [Bacillus sp. FJAT-49711]|uniref:amidase domain-containing protein n=1 Tax=Bacillus sp. FJAT-49711 TaxID=2833585 RepID=UPI001BC97188|nr:amidase domain-containing protein [Bacillus sp. FJAT-49711]MBS4218174.1 amidase domain-containing protein [Bacillus sp. FJAT-49711]